MKTIALIAHDTRKMDIAEWANYNKEKLKNFNLVGTSGTAQIVKNITGLEIKTLGHGPDGGDIYIAKEILDGNIDKVIFLIDVRTPLGHEADIQALIRTCVLQNIPFALNRETANLLFIGLHKECE